MPTEWFAVDRKGLAAIVKRRGWWRVCVEPLSNAWDQNVTEVHVQFNTVKDEPFVTLRVEDDDPEGFANLADAYTFFGATPKQQNATVRGRFNQGEKHIIACAMDARIESTKGTVDFSEAGRVVSNRRKRAAGSEFCARLRMNREDFADTYKWLQRVLPPEGIKTYLNGIIMPVRKPLKVITATLPTELFTEDGPRRSARRTEVEIHEVKTGETAMLYEMGIPVVETGDKWHVNILQKVPLNSDRDNVTPAFLQQVRVLVLNAMHAELTEADAGAKWVKAASDDARVEEAALSTVLHQQFGDKLVSYDPSDTGANNRAVAAGFTVLHGRNLTATQWEKVRDFGLVKPAGKVTPDKPHFSGIADTIPSDKYTPLMVRFTRYARFLARQFFRVDLSVVWLDAGGLGATYCRSNTTLTLYRDSMPDRWLAADNVVAHDKLLIHELGHHEADGHLTEEYYEALCDLGARAIEFALAHTDEMKKARE